MEKDQGQYLSLETSAAGDEVFLHASPAGLRQLAGTLERLAAQAEAGEAEHDHFFTEAWGGHELSGELQVLGNTQVHHLKLYAWPNGGATGNGA